MVPITEPIVQIIQLVTEHKRNSVKIAYYTNENEKTKSLNYFSIETQYHPDDDKHERRIGI